MSGWTEGGPAPNLDPAVRNLIARRAQVRGLHVSDLTWVRDDPLIGFLGPVARAVNPDRTQRLNHRIRYVLFVETAQRVLALFQNHDIPVIPLKGIALAKELYPYPEDRPMGDIDLLVPEDQFDRAIGLLTDMGFRVAEGETAFRLQDVHPTVRPFLPGALTLVDARGVVIDLHWHLSSDPWFRAPRRIPMTEIWQRARPAAHRDDLPGAWELDPVDALAYLCLNVGRDAFRSLQGLLDVDRFLRQHTVQKLWPWSVFVQRCQQWRIAACAFYVLITIRFLFDTPAPLEVLNALEPGRWSRWCVGILVRPHQLLEWPRRAPGLRYPLILMATMLDSFRDAMRLGRFVALPPRAYIRWRYGAGAGIFHHWIHVFRFIWHFLS